MSGDGDLPAEVRAAVARWIDGLDALEVLIHLHRGAHRGWSSSEIAVARGLGERATARALARFAALGLAAVSGEGVDATWRYTAPDDASAASVEAIAAAYRERRTELINHVASDALRRIRDLADAFRIGKGKREE